MTRTELELEMRKSLVDLLSGMSGGEVYYARPERVCVCVGVRTFYPRPGRGHCGTADGHHQGEDADIWPPVLRCGAVRQEHLGQ